MSDNIESKIEDLARMVKTGFDSIENEFKDLKAEMNTRFNRLEVNHANRIQNLEDDMRVVKTSLEKAEIL